MRFQSNKKPVDNTKLRGGYYTPEKLAEYLARWAIRSHDDRILEPSCGDGNFVTAALRRLASLPRNGRTTRSSIVAVEIDQAEIEKAKARALGIPSSFSAISWRSGDFFQLYPSIANEEGISVVLGNPPFIRFQHFDDVSRDTAFAYLQFAGYRPTKLANAWAAFVQLSMELLEPGGRLAMVVPAEILQVAYASELRNRLVAQFEQILIIGFRKLVFPEIQQEVVLLLADGKRENPGSESDIHTIEFEDGEDLLGHDDLRSTTAHIPSKHTRSGMKWTSLFLSETAFSALDEAEKAPGIVSLGDLASVDVGVVTGKNSFFLLHDEVRTRIAATRYTTPVVGRTSALKSTVFRKEDYARYQEKEPAFLLNLGQSDEARFPKKLRDYLDLGESESVHQGYKCRIRKRWFDVPSIYVPDAFLFRQIHKFPLLVVNDAGATSTDTIHRVRLRNGASVSALAAASFNSLTLAWAEVGGRSYGGGVLELEPREAEELPIPYSHRLNIDNEKVDSLLRQGKEIEALDYVDAVALKEHFGFDTTLIGSLRKAWIELRDRRIQRR